MFFWGINMIKTTVVLMIIFVAGCSYTGLGSSAKSGTSNMHMGKTETNGNNAVIDKNGNVNPYRGG